jgi:hypothetical protein
MVRAYTPKQTSEFLKLLVISQSSVGASEAIRLRLPFFQRTLLRFPRIASASGPKTISAPYVTSTYLGPKAIDAGTTNY